MTTALENVNIFDGNNFVGPGRLVFNNQGVIVDSRELVTDVLDCKGAYLLPGLIDAHVHLHGRENLVQMASHGITTALDMGIWPLSLLQSLRNRAGVTDIRSCGMPAAAPGSRHSRIPNFPADGLPASEPEAIQFVAKRVSEGADYIKVVSDIPGFSQETLDALVIAAHDSQKMVIAHAVTLEATRMAQNARVDVLTHAPLNKPMEDSDIEKMLLEKRICVPTLTMMEAVANSGKVPDFDYQHAHGTVKAMHKAGISILAGSDSNNAPGVPANIAHGISIHREMELLVDAGLSVTDALRAATILPATHFGLPDRGALLKGRRADLILLSNNPLNNIKETCSIQGVWINGARIT